jgi:hypothetical protein
MSSDPICVVGLDALECADVGGHLIARCVLVSLPSRRATLPVSMCVISHYEDLTTRNL